MNTYTKDSRVIMYTSTRRGVVYSQILDLRGTEDDVLIRFLHRWDEFRGGPGRKACHNGESRIYICAHRLVSVPMEYTEISPHVNRHQRKMGTRAYHSKAGW